MFAFETRGLLRVEGLELFQFGLVCRVKVGYTLYILTLAYYVIISLQPLSSMRWLRV